MTLDEVAVRPTPLSLSLIGGDRVLSLDIQRRLTAAGLLDPPADGAFGPVSQWALREFFRATGRANAASLDAAGAASLLNDADAVFAIRPTSTLAGRLAAAVTASGHFLCRHPSCVNVVYVEGMDADGTPNIDEPDVFNDLRLVLRIAPSGKPEMIESWEATTEPGAHYTLVEHDPRGAARIAFGQYKAWSVGVHMKDRPTAHEALVQTAAITVHRDLNQDFERTGDVPDTGIFGINQHWGFDQARSKIGKASAGCLVGRTKSGHRAFMSLCKADPRFASNHGYRFMTAVLPASAVPPA